MEVVGYGVLYELLGVPEILENATSKALVLGTLDYIMSKQFPSGNFPGEYYDETEDVLVQWDHGAPGVATALDVALRTPRPAMSARTRRSTSARSLSSGSG